MKKSILTLVFMALIACVSAQTLQFELEGEALTDGQMVYCTEFDPDFGEYIQEMQLHNISGDDLNVIIEREIIDVPDGGMTYFCWGMCFSPSVSVSPAVPMQAGAVSGPGELGFHYTPAALTDVAFVKYYAYDERQPDERVSVIIAYNTTESVGENTRPMLLGQAYPNPASTMVNFDYNLSGSNASAVVYNLMGQEVMRQEINTFDGKLSLSVADLNDGIYFCTVMRNGQTFATVKFVVKK